MTERLKVVVLKTTVVRATVGSNPTLSAKYFHMIDDSLKEKTKFEKIQSGVFSDSTHVSCEYYKSCQSNNCHKYEDPMDSILKNYLLLEDAIDLITSCDNTLLKSININLDDTDIKRKTLSYIKNNWRDIDQVDPDLTLYDKSRADACVTIILETTYFEIKKLSEETLENWCFTFLTPFGEFEIY